MPKEHKRRAMIQVSEEMIIKMLGLNSEEVSLARIHHEYHGTVKFIIEGENFPQIIEGQEPRCISTDVLDNMEE